MTKKVVNTTQSQGKQFYSYADTLASVKTVQKELKSFDFKPEGWILSATLADVRQHDSELELLQRKLDYLNNVTSLYRDAIRTRARAARFSERLNTRLAPHKKRLAKLAERIHKKVMRILSI